MSFHLLELWRGLQRQLFPALQQELGPLSDHDRRFVEVMALIPVEPFLQAYQWGGNGRPPASRFCLLQSFVAKAVYGFPTTQALVDELLARPALRQLCGYDSPGEVPTPSTFSRAFADFAEDQLPQRLHEAMIKTCCGPQLAGHTSHDATAIAARERIAPSPEAPVAPPRPQGRPKKGAPPPPPPPLTRLQRQLHCPLAENLAGLPVLCDHGTKTGSQGWKASWRGYKLHLSVIDGDVPVAALLTSASTHDSQAAIPLLQMTAQRVRSLYDLMDKAYDAGPIHDFVRSLGHVPIIEPVHRGNAWIPLDPAQRQRFKQRSSCERVNSRLKDEFGGGTVRVRGAAKVMAHLMFGTLAIAALAIWNRLG